MNQTSTDSCRPRSRRTLCGWAGQHNPAMYYFTGGVHLTDAILVKPRGDEPLIFHYPMERDEAAKTGLRTKSLNDYNYVELTNNSGEHCKGEYPALSEDISDMDLTSGNVGFMA